MKIDETLEEILRTTVMVRNCIERDDIEKIDDILDLRQDLLESIQDELKNHVLSETGLKIVDNIRLEEDRIREIARKEMEELRNQANNVKLGAKAIKNGYMKINEEFRVKRDFSGRG